MQAPAIYVRLSCCFVIIFCSVMVNKVILIGNVGNDPEIRTLESGVKRARLRMATTERIFSRQTQEVKEHTEWHTVLLWRNLADVADRYIRKGSQIYVEGRLRTNEWQDEHGNQRSTIEVLADDLKLLGRRQDPAGGAGKGPGTQGAEPGPGHGGGIDQSVTKHAAPQPSAEDPDNLPF